MSDILSPQVSHEFWKNYQDPSIYRVICFMEGVENWTHDGDPDLEAAIEILAAEIEKTGDFELGQEEDFIKLAAHLRASRTLRLMQCLDSAHPGAASKLLVHAEENSETQDDVLGLFLRRNIVFERLRLLSRVFAPERFSLVMKALEEEDE